MLPASDDWSIRYSRTFIEQLDERRYRRDSAAILRRVSEMVKDPYRGAGAERLRHQFAGLRSARVLGPTRLIYRICEECRRLEERDRRPLDCCVSGQTPDRTVNVLALSEHYAGMPERFEFDDPQG